MRAHEFIAESSSPTITVKDANKALIAMGFKPTGRQKGSHSTWKDASGLLFTIPFHGKELDYGVTKNLYRLMKSRGYNFSESVVVDKMAAVKKPRYISRRRQ